MKTTSFLTAGLAAGALTLVSCTPNQQQYALGGGAAGGILGAITGDDSGDIAKGIAVGALAGGGYAAYQDHKNGQNGTFNTGGDTTQKTSSNQQGIVSYPTATRSDIAGVVVSPYKPYNQVRVTNFKPGQLAKDPTTNQIFVVPQ